MHLVSIRAAPATTPLTEPGTAKSEIQFLPESRHALTYRPDIDGLRALAIIPVILFHAFPSLMPGGFVGVDIFFVISGFLISNILLRALENGTFSFAGFYANRVRRLFPALLLVLAACFAAGWFLLLPDEYARLGKHIVGAAAYVENLVLRRETGYFDVRSQLKPLVHLWSLGIEEQFYLSYPLFLWAMWRIRRGLLATLVLIALASFALNIVQVRGDAAGAFFLPQARWWELMVGSTIACWQVLGEEARPAINWLRPLVLSRWPRVDGGFFRNISSAIGAALIIMALGIHDTGRFPGWLALLPVLGAALLILAGPNAQINRRVLCNGLAVFVGLISYPLYLWHWPILSFSRILTGGEVSVKLRIAGVILSFALAWLTFRFIETPIRFARKNWVRPLALAGISVALACVGYAATRNGFLARFPQAEKDLGDLRKAVWSTTECSMISGLSKVDYCRTTSARNPDILLIGDSHASVLYDGLAPLYQQRSLTLMNLGEAGCAPLYDTHTFSPREDGKKCMPSVNAFLNFAVHAPSVRTIIFSARGPRYMSGQGFSQFESERATETIWWEGVPESTAQPEMYAGALRHTISLLVGSGKTVIFFIDWPELGFDPRSCLPRPFRLFPTIRKFCGLPRIEVDARNRAYRKLVFQLSREFGSLKLFDPLPSMCDSSACYALGDGHLLYSDDNHLSISGARYLAAKYFEDLN